MPASDNFRRNLRHAHLAGTRISKAAIAAWDYGLARATDFAAAHLAFIAAASLALAATLIFLGGLEWDACALALAHLARANATIRALAAALSLRLALLRGGALGARTDGGT
jgi:hypothetical protein